MQNDLHPQRVKAFICMAVNEILDWCFSFYDCVLTHTHTQTHIREHTLFSFLVLLFSCFSLLFLSSLIPHLFLSHLFPCRGAVYGAGSGCRGRWCSGCVCVCRVSGSSAHTAVHWATSQTLHQQGDQVQNRTWPYGLCHVYSGFSCIHIISSYLSG